MTFNVLVGAQDLNQSVQYNAFLPDNLTINAGDTIVFTKNTAEAHTVTFNIPREPISDFLRYRSGDLQVVEANPRFFLPSPPREGPPPPLGAPVDVSLTFDGNGFFNSGSLESPNDIFRVAFTKPGVYTYACMFHLAHMKGTIMVKAQGTPYPKTQADYDKDNLQHLATHKATAEAFFDRVRAQVPESATQGDGSRNFTVFSGAGDPPNGTEFNRFVGGDNLTVKAGDTVTWTWEHSSPFRPHTVAFLEPGHAALPVIIVPPQPETEGPPRMFVHPLVEGPSPDVPQPYEGTGYFNSGILINGGPTAQSYSLTFTKAGTYKYLCLIHDPAGMNGTITVIE
jgi:plastocyanin